MVKNKNSILKIQTPIPYTDQSKSIFKYFTTSDHCFLKSRFRATTGEIYINKGSYNKIDFLQKFHCTLYTM